MTKTRTITLLLLVGAGLEARAQEDKKPDPIQLARSTSHAFLAATITRDLDTVMKFADVPFCNDGRELIKQRENLRDHFTKLFARPRVFVMATVHIRMVGTVAEFKESKKIPPMRKLSLAENLTNTDRIVFAELEHDGRFEPIWLGIRIEKGVAKVVGVVG